MRRYIRICFEDGNYVDLEIAKAASIKTKKQMINLEKMEDGNWRLIYSQDTIPDFSKVKSFEVIRED